MFLNVLETLMDNRGLNLNQLSKLSKIPYMTLKNFWVKGYENTKLSTLKQLAEYFNVSLDYLVFGKDNVYSNENNKYNKLNSLGQHKADEYINDLLENPKYTKETPVQIPPAIEIAAYHGENGVASYDAPPEEIT